MTEAASEPQLHRDAVSPQAVFLSFHAEVNTRTSEALVSVVAQQMMQGNADIHLLLSTPGGEVAPGLALYNTLRALPINLITYNVGTVNSIGNVIYLAGSRRFACPTSSFMFHGVGFDINGALRMEEKNLQEHLASLRNDQSLIAQIISGRTHIDAQEVERLFLQAAFVRPADAQATGIVHEIRDPRIPTGAPVLQLVFQR